MAGYLVGDSSSQHSALENSSINKAPHDISMDEVGGCWYMSRKEIEENSPSRRDGIDLKKETYFRKLYCTFLQDLGMRLKVPQVTIATAVVFCHRFFLRHSHAKHDRRTVATACMFLAGKVEETPRPLKDVILVSYEIIHKKDPAAAQKIKQKEVYEQQKELILVGERVVLSTLAFDFNVHHPYKPLVEAIKKFKVAQNALAQVAWNFVNDGLRTSLCLQFKPHHIAAGAIFLAAKFLKVKLPSDGEKVWWQEFDVTPRQLEEVSNQMLELYEQNKLPQGSELEVSGGAVHNQRGPIKASAASEELVSSNGPIPATGGSVSSSGKPGASKHTSARSGADQVGNLSASLKTGHFNDDGSTEMSSVINEHKLDLETKDDLHVECAKNDSEKEVVPNRTETKEDRAGDDDRMDDGKGNETADAGKHVETGFIKPIVGRNIELGERPVSQSPHDALKTLDTDKWKAQAEKIRKSRADITRKKDVVDEDDLIERALEDGVESAVEDERMIQERKQSWLKNEAQYHNKDHDIHNKNVHSSRGAHIVEEGEMLDESSPMVNSRKRKGSPVDKRSENKHHREYLPAHHHNDSNTHDDGHRAGKGGKLW